jgi:hypothetical protein
MFYVWLGLIAAGWLKPLWRWIQGNRARSWPLTTGQIVSATVDESKPFFVSTPRRGSTVYVAELGYSYSVVGHTEASFYKRENATQLHLRLSKRGEAALPNGSTQTSENCPCLTSTTRH